MQRKKLLEKSIHGRKKGWERESDSWKIIHHLQRYQNSASDNSKLLFWHFSRVQPSWYRQNSRNIDADILLASLKRHRSIQNKNFSLPTRKKIPRCKKKDKYFLADEPEKQHRMARMPAAPPCWMHQAPLERRSWAALGQRQYLEGRLIAELWRQLKNQPMTIDTRIL